MSKETEKLIKIILTVERKEDNKDAEYDKTENS